jgi:hypothetical protein
MWLALGTGLCAGIRGLGKAMDVSTRAGYDIIGSATPSG